MALDNGTRAVATIVLSADDRARAVPSAIVAVGCSRVAHSAIAGAGQCGGRLTRREHPELVSIVHDVNLCQSAQNAVDSGLDADTIYCNFATFSANVRRAKANN